MDRVRITTVGQPTRDVALADSLSIGRSPENGLRLASRDVSGHHLRLERRDGRCFVEDLDSRHGTLLNGSRLTPRELHPLRSGDRIVVSGYVIEYLDAREQTVTLDAANRYADSDLVLPPSRPKPRFGVLEKRLATVLLLVATGALLATVLAAIL